MTFKPGQSGNPKGRPVGSKRELLATDFLTDLVADWNESGKDAIRSMRTADPVAYVNMVARLLPRETKIEAHHDIDIAGTVAVSRVDEWIKDTLARTKPADPAPSLPN